MRFNFKHIRQTHIEDVAVLTGIIQQAYQDVARRFNLTPENCPKHPSNCTDTWVKRDLARGVLYYILQCDDMPAGCVALEKASPNTCYLERLAVLPEMRRNGFGRMLVDHVLDEASLIGAKQVSIGIIADQAELKSWYKNMGFKEEATKQFEHLPFHVTFLTYGL